MEIIYGIFGFIIGSLIVGFVFILKSKNIDKLKDKEIQKLKITNQVLLDKFDMN